MLRKFTTSTKVLLQQQCYYDVLNVSRASSKEQIKLAFRAAGM